MSTISSVSKEYSHLDHLAGQSAILQDPEALQDLRQRTIALHRSILKQGRSPSSDRALLAAEARKVETLLGKVGVRVVRKTERQRSLHLPSSSPVAASSSPSLRRRALLLQAGVCQFSAIYRSYAGAGVSCPAHVLEFGLLASRQVQERGSFWNDNGQLGITSTALRTSQDQAIAKFSSLYQKKKHNDKYLAIDEVQSGAYSKEFNEEQIAKSVYEAGIGPLLAHVQKTQCAQPGSTALLALGDGDYFRGLTIHHRQNGQYEYAFSDSHGSSVVGSREKTYAYFTTDAREVEEIVNKLFKPTQMQALCYIPQREKIKEKAISSSDLGPESAVEMRSSAKSVSLSSSLSQGVRQTYRAAREFSFL